MDGNTVGIVGGGAAGMMAAIAAAESGARVTLLEGNDRLGKKILSTGNGKCNLGNEKLDLEEYYTGSPAFLADCLGRFGTVETVSFFQGIGLMVKSRNGYLYPACEQAAAVLDVLRYEVRAAGVEVVTDFKVESIRLGRRARQFNVQGREGGRSFDRVILACGGKAVPKTGSDGSGYRLARQLGHSLVPTVPALVQLRCREDCLKAVAGVRADAELSVCWQGKCVSRERGELQLTEYGISGIPVFQLSRTVNYILLGKNPGRLAAAEKETLLSGIRIMRQIRPLLEDACQRGGERSRGGKRKEDREISQRSLTGKWRLSSISCRITRTVISRRCARAGGFCRGSAPWRSSLQGCCIKSS